MGLRDDGEIDLSCPIDWSHDLNRDRRAWWLTLPEPGWWGGTTWRDIVGHSGRAPNHGTVVGIAASEVDSTGAAWQGSDRPGGSGHLRLAEAAGISGRATVPNTAAIDGSGSALAFGCWCRPLSVQDSAAELIKNGSYILRFGGSSAIAVFLITSSGLQNFTTAAGVAPPGVWTRLLAVYGSGTLSLFANGAFVQSTSIAGTMVASTGLMGIGADSGGPEQYRGDIDDVSVWGAGSLASGDPATFAGLDYSLSRAGYPGVLTRAGYPAAISASVSAPPAGGTFRPMIGSPFIRGVA